LIFLIPLAISGVIYLFVFGTMICAVRTQSSDPLLQSQRSLCLWCCDRTCLSAQPRRAWFARTKEVVQALLVREDFSLRQLEIWEGPYKWLGRAHGTISFGVKSLSPFLARTSAIAFKSWEVI
jgi:hypothetical protein